MAHTTSFAWPNFINVAQNCVDIVEDNKAITSRTRLLMLTDPTELYHNPQFGLGLRKHLFKYNTENEKQIIRDDLVRQLELYEPYVIPAETQYANGLLFTGEDEVEMYRDQNKLNMTISVHTTYSDTVDIVFNDEAE